MKIYVFPERPAAWDHVLWPGPSKHNWMAPGAVTSRESAFKHIASGLDYGALRQLDDGSWEILASAAGERLWMPFDGTDALLNLQASAYGRYGQGVSYGPGHNQHSEAQWYYKEVHGHDPDPMLQTDIEHDRSLWNDLKKAYFLKLRQESPPDGEIPSGAGELRVEPPRLAAEGSAGSAGEAELVLRVPVLGRWRIASPVRWSGVAGVSLTLTSPLGLVTGPREAHFLLKWPAGLPAGKHDGTVVVTAGAKKQRVPVVLDIKDTATGQPPVPEPVPTPTRQPEPSPLPLPVPPGLPPLSPPAQRVEELREIVREISLTHPETIIESRIVSIASMSSDILGSPTFWTVIKHYAIGALKLFRIARKSIHNDPRPLP